MAFQGQLSIICVSMQMESQSSIIKATDYTVPVTEVWDVTINTNLPPLPQQQDHLIIHIMMVKWWMRQLHTFSWALPLSEVETILH